MKIVYIRYKGDRWNLTIDLSGTIVGVSVTRDGNNRRDEYLNVDQIPTKVIIDYESKSSRPASEEDVE